MADETPNPTSETTPTSAPESTPARAESEAEAATAVAESPAPEVRLKQEIQITDAGPCKKHVKVIIDRVQIDQRFNERYTELVKSDQPQVRGFRPGKAPRKLIERQYHQAVAEEVKTQVLMASLEQLAEEQLIAPLSPPDFDPHAVFIPEQGPFIYEFDIEVRPEFDLPDYKGVQLRRPVHAFTDAEVETERKRLLERYGQLAPKEGADAAVALNDTITADVVISYQGKEINRLEETQVKVEKQLALSDGVSRDFGARMAGAKVGDVREVEIELSQELGTASLRGERVKAVFTVKDIKETRQPEITPELVYEAFGLTNPDQLDDFVRVVLERRLEYTQRQEARQQVLEKLAGGKEWDLPQDMLRKQASRTLSRRILEMRNAGMSEEQIRGRRRLLEQDVLKSTAAALKEHFVLQKIAEIEKIEIEDDDIEAEIESIADRLGESYRKTKARMEKEDMIEAIAADLLERRALDLVLDAATYEDYEWNAEEESGEVATVSADVVPESETKPEEAKPEEARAEEPKPGAESGS